LQHLPSWVLFKFTDAFFRYHDPRPIRDRSRLFPVMTTPPSSRASALAATLIGGFLPADSSRGAIFVGREPVDTARGCCRRSPNLFFSWLGDCRRQSMGAGIRQLRRKNFTSAIGTGIFVAYLSALLQKIRCTTATQYASLNRTRRCGAHLFVLPGAGLRGPKADGVAACVVVFAIWRRGSARLPSLILLAWLQRARAIFGDAGAG